MRTSRIAPFATTAALAGLPSVAAPAGAARSNEPTAELTRLDDAARRTRISA
ncbi:hypothetical protein [Promicromonospora sukumoe]|uniref:hypothetical protein n=1 Tax=Promicromonospora sukumoe TaxID=88382 RepID=UPI0036549DB1